MIVNRKPRVPAWAIGPIVLNAIYYGYLSIALPIHLTQQVGMNKVETAVFFSVSALTAMVANLALTPFVRRQGYPRWAFAAACALAALGLTGLAVADHPSALVFASGMAVVVMTTVFPLYVGLVSRMTRSDATVIAEIRQIYVVAFMCGLGSFAFVSFMKVPLIVVAAAIALLAALVSVFQPRRAVDATVTATSMPFSAASATARIRVGTLLVATTGVLLMKAADALRGIYLPVVAIGSGLAQPLVSALFLVTTIVELLVLRPLARAGRRIGSDLALAAIAGAGAVAFVAPGVFSGVAILFLSQALYAVFAAGFQLLGMVQLGRLLPSGTEGGASLYTATIQLGTVVGAVAPLLAPGYSPTIFLIAASLCVVAGTCMLTVWLTTRGATSMEHA